MQDLVGMVQEARVMGHISRSINSTFITLIPKKSNTESFMDYMPISLCNIVYKSISKITAECIKGILSRHISREQSRFLHNRLMHGAVAIAQETIHSIYTKMMEALVMKHDLYKTYHSLDWAFLRLTLLKIGLSNPIIEWIMPCVTRSQFVLIINEFSSKFFVVGRGL